jgi:hypothetical protein
MNVSKVMTLGIVFCGIIFVFAKVNAANDAFGAEEMVGMQDVRMLDRRISLLEQRLYAIESSINRLEQSSYSQRSTVPQPGTRDRDINLITEELQKVNLRLSEIECGLVKLDERTKVPGSDGRVKSTDACRLQPTAPLRLSTRP